MQIVIIGAGRIGRSAAETLVNESNDISVIDTDPDRIQFLQERFDLRGVVGDACSPSVLIEAGAQDADMVVAVTDSDETNLVVCMLAARLFNIPTRIARVRNSELQKYPRLLAEEGFRTTSVIWPEKTLTDSLVRLIEFPEALQVVDFSDGKASLISLRARAGSPLVGRPIRDIAVHLPHIPARIISIFRRSHRLELSAQTVVESGDEVFILSSGRDIRRVINELRQHEKPVRHILIGGNSELGIQLAETLCQAENRPDYTIRIIEENPQVSRALAAKAPEGTMILDGRINDEAMLEAGGIDLCDLYLALSNDDENNIMSSLMAKKLGARRVIALINRQSYADLMQGTQIDITVTPAQLTLGELLKHVRRGDVVSSHSLRRGVAEALELVAHGSSKNSRVVGRRIADIRLPEGVSIAAMIRDEEDDCRIIMGSPNAVIEPEDHVIVFVPSKRLIPKVEQLFAVDVGFF